jgi:hypothetical protein
VIGSTIQEGGQFKAATLKERLSVIGITLQEGCQFKAATLKERCQL